MSNRTYNYLFGGILVAVSLFEILKNTSITSWGFYSFGGINTGAILFLLLLIDITAYVFRPSKITLCLIPGIIAMMILSLILGLRLYFRHLSLLNGLLIFVPLAIGLGLIMKALFTGVGKKK